MCTLVWRTWKWNGHGAFKKQERTTHSSRGKNSPRRKKQALDSAAAKVALDRPSLCARLIAVARSAEVHAHRFASLLHAQRCEEFAASDHCREARALEHAANGPSEGLLPLVPLQRRQASDADT